MIGEREEEGLGTGMPEFVLIKKEVQQLELTHFLPSFFFFCRLIPYHHAF